MVFNCFAVYVLANNIRVVPQSESCMANNSFKLNLNKTYIIQSPNPQGLVLVQQLIKLVLKVENFNKTKAPLNNKNQIAHSQCYTRQEYKSKHKIHTEALVKNKQGLPQGPSVNQPYLLDCFYNSPLIITRPREGAQIRGLINKRF